MSFFLASIRKDLDRWRRDVAALLLWLGIPLLIGSLITALIGGGGGPMPTGTLLIADEDSTLVSGFVAGAYSQDQLGDLITVQQVSVEDGEEMIAAGEASGFLVIPEGFQDAFFNQEPVTLTLKTNPSQTILPRIITDVTEILLDAGFYGSQLFADEFDKIQSVDEAEGPDEILVAEVAVSIQRRIEAIEPKLFPPIIDIEIVEPPPAEPQPNFALMYMPGIIMMALLFGSNGLAADYWRERESGTLRRLTSTPGGLAPFVAGKAAGAVIVVSAIAAIALLLGFVYHGIDWAKFMPSLVWVSLGGLALFSWLALLQMMLPTSKSADAVSTVLLFPLLMAGGSFFPMAALPDWLAAIGRVSPNGFVADRLTVELTGVETWAFAMTDWLVVAAAAFGGLALSAWRLSAGFARR